MESAPPEFRAEYERLRTVIEPSSGKSIAQLLGKLRGEGFVVNPSGGHRLSFMDGSICSFDHTGRFPLVYLYGPIFYLHRKLGGAQGCFGRPITSVTDLPDGSKCCITEGGHIHSMGEIAEPFLAEHCIAPYKPVPPLNPFGIRPGGLPASFHQRWMELSTVRHPSGKTIVEILGCPRDLTENPCGGQRFRFEGGHLVSLNNNSLPYVIYGEIWGLWRRLGLVDSGWGRPLTDEQELEDGGRCSVFEGGHIHCYAGIARGYPAESCVATHKPTTRAVIFNQMPPHFQRKWSQLALQIQPLAQKSVAELLGEPWHRLRDNPNKPGQNFHFNGGLLVSLDNNPNPAPMQAMMTTQPPMNPQFYGGPPGSPQMTQTYGIQGQYGAPSPMYELPNSGRTPYGQQDSKNPPLETIPPFAVYGAICEYFKKEGNLAGKYGRPLCDEQDLGDGGRCGIFEGGHIHLYNGVARGAAAEICTAPYQPQPPPPPPSGVSPNPNYQSQGGVHHQPNWGPGGGGGGGYDYQQQPNYPATPQPQIYGGNNAYGQSAQQNLHPKRPSGFWYCLTGIDLDQAPEECGPWCIYATTGLLPGQHSGYCCHGCCRVTF